MKKQLEIDWNVCSEDGYPKTPGTYLITRDTCGVRITSTIILDDIRDYIGNKAPSDYYEVMLKSMNVIAWFPIDIIEPYFGCSICKYNNNGECTFTEVTGEPMDFAPCN